MKSFSEKYFPDLNEFEHQYNDIWFNNMLYMLRGDTSNDPDLPKEIDAIFEELEGVVDKYYDKIERAKSKQPTPDW